MCLIGATQKTLSFVFFYCLTYIYSEKYGLSGWFALIQEKCGMRRMCKFLCFMLSGFVLVPSMVAAEGTAMGLKVSTLGAGVEIAQSFSKYINGRLSAQYFKYSDSYSSSSVNYDGDLELKSILGTLDYYPFETIVHFSAGALLNGNNIGMRAQSPKGISADNNLISALFGDLDGEVTLNTVAPYVGLGFGNPVAGDEAGFAFKADIGLVYQGNPAASLSSTGLLAGTPLGQALIANEEAELQEDVDGYKWYPVVGVSLLYRF